MIRPRRARRAAVVVALALALTAACGDDDGGDGGDEASTATTTTAASADGSSTTTASTAAPDDAGDGDGAEVEPVASDGCGAPPDTPAIGADRPGDVPLTFVAEGVERTYRLAVPADYDPEVPVPLLLNLHGSGSDALQAGAYGDVPRAATARGIVVAAPEALGGNWELGDGADDRFLLALTDDLTSRYCIDLDRVHVIGMSLGAWKAAFTACRHPDVFASAALVTVEVFPGTCEPLAVVAFHGTGDVVAPYGEGGTQPVEGGPNAGISGARDNIEAWAANGACDPEPELSRIGDDVEERRFTGCDDGVDVVLYSIDGGGHTWPGSDIIIGPPEWTTDTIDATAIALDFFADHPLRAGSSPNE